MLVVEDDQVLADALGSAFRGAGYAVDSATSGAEADRALAAQEFDLVILDVELPEVDGYEVLRRARGRKQSVPVLILTARERVHDRIRGLDTGADDYLTKPFAMGELMARARALIRRAEGRAENKIEAGPLLMHVTSRGVWLNSVPLAVSAREFAVLEVLASRVGRVVSKDALMASVYAWEKDVGPNAIEIVVHRLRRKLHGSGVAIRTARGLGYLLEPATNGSEPLDER